MIDDESCPHRRQPALIQSVLLVVAFSTLALASPPQVGRTGYDIAFVSERDGQRGIYLMRGDGSQAVPILAAPNAILLSSSWSPDGERIAYFDLRPDDEELYRTHDLPFHFALYVMNPDGGDRERLLDIPVKEFAWSPDSRQLVFTSGYEDPRVDNPRGQANLEEFSTAIYVVDLQRRETRRLTPLGDNRSPSWSPDGRRIALSGADPGAANSDIYIVDADGSDRQRLTNLPTDETQPAWSPRGDWIAFAAAPKRGLASEEGGVFVVRPDGSDPRRISSTGDGDLAWSADGQHLLVTPSATLIDVTSGDAIELANNGVDAMFAPEGEAILYRSNDEGDWNLYAVNLDGGNRTRLTSNRGDDLMFTVSPLLRRTP